MFRFYIPETYCSQLAKYVFIEVALKHNYIQQFEMVDGGYLFMMEDSDLYRLFNVPISELGYSRNKELLAVTEWNYCIDYLIGEYSDEFGNIKEVTDDTGSII